MGLKNLLAMLVNLVPKRIKWCAIWFTQSTFTVGVSAVVLDNQDRILLLKHRFRDDQTYELPGGFIRRGETLEEGLKRELREETGLEVKIESELRTSLSHPSHVDVSYLSRVTHGPLVTNDTEVLVGRFFFPHQLPEELPEEHAKIIALAIRRGPTVG